MLRIFILSGLWVLCANSASAADMLSIEVDYVDGRYSMESVMWFDAGVHETYEVFSDFDLSTKFSSAIVEARNLEPDVQGRPGYYILTRYWRKSWVCLKARLLRAGLKKLARTSHALSKILL